MGSRLDGMVLGEAVPPEVLQQLGVDGKRAVVAFFCRDNGHECMQELRDLESRATRYRADFSCDIVAIRSRGSWVNEDTASKYPSLRFIVDEDEELRQAFRMEIGQINDRQSYLLDAEGRVRPQVESARLGGAHSSLP
jgi:peroxiredoxin